MSETVLMEMDASRMKLAGHLAPAVLLNRLALPNYYGLLAVDKDTKTPCGIMIYSVARANRLDVEWLYVYSNYRYRGIGSTLLEAAFELAHGAKIPFVGFRMEGNLATEKNVRAIGDFVREFGFSLGTNEDADWEYSIEDFDERKTEEVPDGVRNLCPCERIDTKLIRAYLSERWDAIKMSPLYDFDRVIKSFDKHFSVAYMENEKICGLLLTAVFEDVMYPLVFDALDPKHLGALMTGMRMILKRSGKENMRCHVAYSPRAEEIQNKYLPAKKYVPVYVWQSASDYLLNIREEEDRPVDVFGYGAPDEYRWLKNEYFGDFAY